MKRMVLVSSGLVVGVVIGCIGTYVVLKNQNTFVAPADSVIEVSKNEPQSDQDKLNKCVADAETEYKTRWNSACERLGNDKNVVDSLGKACGLPEDQAKHYDNEFNIDREFCLKMYN